MQILHIVNLQKEPLAKVTWEFPDKVNLDVLDKSKESDLISFVEGAKKGIPLRTGYEEERDNHRVFVDEQVLIKPDDSRFLQALADIVSRHKFGQQRAFGLLKQQKESEK